MLLTARTPSRYASALAALSVFMAALLLPLSFTGGVMTTPRYSSRWAALRCAVVADQWHTYADFRQLCWPQGDGGCHRQKTVSFIAGAALFCLSSLLFCLTHNLFLSGVLRGSAGPGRGDDFSQRQWRGAV